MGAWSLFSGVKGVKTLGQVPCLPRGCGTETEPPSPTLLAVRGPGLTPEPEGHLPLPADPRLRGAQGWPRGRHFLVLTASRSWFQSLGGPRAAGADA